MILADGYEAAIMGYVETEQGRRVLYSLHRCLEILVERDGMTWDEANEYFYFNTVGAYLPGGPLYFEPATLDRLHELADLDDEGIEHQAPSFAWSAEQIAAHHATRGEAIEQGGCAPPVLAGHTRDNPDPATLLGRSLMAGIPRPSRDRVTATEVRNVKAPDPIRPEATEYVQSIVRRARENLNDAIDDLVTTGTGVWNARPSDALGSSIAQEAMTAAAAISAVNSRARAFSGQHGGRPMTLGECAEAEDGPEWAERPPWDPDRVHTMPDVMDPRTAWAAERTGSWATRWRQDVEARRPDDVVLVPGRGLDPVEVIILVCVGLAIVVVVGLALSIATGAIA